MLRLTPVTGEHDGKPPASGRIRMTTAVINPTSRANHLHNCEMIFYRSVINVKARKLKQLAELGNVDLSAAFSRDVDLDGWTRKLPHAGEGFTRAGESLLRRAHPPLMVLYLIKRAAVRYYGREL